MITIPPMEIYIDGRSKFDSLLNEINNAKKYINIMYYIIQNDELFKTLCKILIKKSKSGIKIKLIYDSFGSRKMPKKIWNTLKNNGIQVEASQPFINYNNISINNYNNRNHKKLVIIDGKTAFLGGFNIGKEYLGMDKKFGKWRDTHFKITDIYTVQQLNNIFLRDWGNAVGKCNIKYNKYRRNSDTTKNSNIKIIVGFPHKKIHTIRDNYIEIINNAKKNIYIQTPYFIPDKAVMNSLYNALKLGISVNIMVPCKPDHPLVFTATYSNIKKMVIAGAKCYCYSDGFLHTKAIMADGKISCCGTANMDMRSFYHNYEINMIFYSTQITNILTSQFIEDIKKSIRINKSKTKENSALLKMKEMIAKLFSPVL